MCGRTWERRSYTARVRSLPNFRYCVADQSGFLLGWEAMVRVLWRGWPGEWEGRVGMEMVLCVSGNSRVGDLDAVVMGWIARREVGRIMLVIAKGSESHL